MSRGTTTKARSAIHEVLEDDVLQCGKKAGLTKLQIIERAGERLQSKYARDRLDELVSAMVEFWEREDFQGEPELDLADRQSPGGDARYRLRRDDWPDADQARSAALSGLWCDHAGHEGRNEFEDCPEDCEHSHEDIDGWIDCPQSLYGEWMAERMRMADSQ